MYARRKKPLTTISSAIAGDSKTSIAFSVAMTIFFPLYYSFLWFWVGLYIAAPSYFYLIIFVSFVAELVFAWAPAIGRTKVTHSIAAGVVGVSMAVISVIVFAMSNNLSDPARVSILLFWIVTLFASIVFTRRFRKYTFLAELIFCLAFLIAISVTAHT